MSTATWRGPNHERPPTIGRALRIERVALDVDSRLRNRSANRARSANLVRESSCDIHPWAALAVTLNHPPGWVMEESTSRVRKTRPWGPIPPRKHAVRSATIAADPVPIGTGTLSVADRYWVRSSTYRSPSELSRGDLRVNLGVGIGVGIGVG